MLPEPVAHYDYVRQWPVLAEGCSAQRAPASALARAQAHARTAEAHIRGDAKFASVGFAADFTDALNQQTVSDRYTRAVQHFSNAIMLQPAEGRFWYGLARACAGHKVASKEEPTKEFLRQQLRLLEMAAALSNLGPSSGHLEVAHALDDADEEDAVPRQIRCSIGISSKNGHVCCTKECGVCGGDRCDKRPGGGAKCCGGSIYATCFSYQGPPPCTYTGFYALRFDMCTDGVLAVRDHTCCSKECGTCGGPGCASLPGGPMRCCGGSIKDSCTSSAGPPPCVYREYRKEWQPLLTAGTGRHQQLPLLLSVLQETVQAVAPPPRPVAQAPVKVPPRAG